MLCLLQIQTRHIQYVYRNTNILGFSLYMGKRWQYSDEAISNANENEYSAVIPVYMQLYAYSDDYNIKSFPSFSPFSLQNRSQVAPVVHPRCNVLDVYRWL